MAILREPQTEGEVRRDAALAILRARRAALIRECQRAAVLHALASGEVTSDSVRAVVTIPPGINPKVVGAVFPVLATAGILSHVGYVKSARPAAHARPVGRWRLISADAANDWLAVHPPIPQPPAE